LFLADIEVVLMLISLLQIHISDLVMLLMEEIVNYFGGFPFECFGFTLW
jgi:hypothetical protein